MTCFAFIRALKAGVKCPLLVLLPDDRFENVELVTLLGALEGLYVVSHDKLLYTIVLPRRKNITTNRSYYIFLNLKTLKERISITPFD